MGDIDREIEAARLLYWQLIAKKAEALGRRPSDVSGRESQYVDIDGNVWLGGVLDGTGWRLAGRLPDMSKDDWNTWGLEAAGPPWCPPSGQKGWYESAILGTDKRTKRNAS